jgi:hypothetical protein
MRQKLFISHANPEDNAFATWLYFKLVGMGYDVWCEIKTLKAGEYFWDKIEDLIRNETVKFLFVSSASSASKRGGVSDEFEFARTIAKDENLDRFVYVLKIDDTPHNARIGQHRINHIDFSNSWADGLRQLAKELAEERVPKKDLSFDEVNTLWRSLTQGKEQLIQSEEVYSSNRFPVIKMPEVLYAHAFKGIIPKETKIWEYPYPVSFYKEYTITFAGCRDFEMAFPSTIRYKEGESLAIPTLEILDGSYSTSFISNQDAQNKLRFLLNDSFYSQLKRSGLYRYKMANKKTAFWYPLDALDKNKAGGVQMVGVQKALHWHYAVSGSFALTPEPTLLVSSHIAFTEDGKNLVKSDSRQHKARRKQGRQWWNKQWREKIHGFLVPLLDDDDNFQITVGDRKRVIVSSESVQFVSPVGYVDPDKSDEEAQADFDDLVPTREDHDDYDEETD